MKIEWQDIFHSNFPGQMEFATARAKVNGGWLITHSMRYGGKMACSSCFMPDENHLWEIKENKDSE